jgi:hypothetical protein
MKAKQTILMVIMIIVGIGIGYYVGKSSSCNNLENVAADAKLTRISADSAHIYFDNYFRTAMVYKEPFKGFTIGREQINALTNLFKNNSTLTGVRIYMAAKRNIKTRVVAGIDERDHDILTHIYRMEVAQSDPCPPICDLQSPIPFTR